MPSLPIVICWLVAIVAGGLTITGLCLYLTRDTGQRASGVRSRRRSDAWYLARWQQRLSAASERLEAASGHLAPVPPGRQSTTLACAGVGHRLCDGRQQIAPGETRPCSCHCHRRPVVLAHPPAVGQAAAARLAREAIEARVHHLYADIEARQVRQLARTAWATWA